MPRLLRHTLIAAVLSGALSVVHADSEAPDSTAIQRAWLAFDHARGEPSRIRGDVNHPTANDVFRTIPDVTAETVDDAKLQLGFDLFHDPRLSRDGSVACASCHIGLMGGVDRRPLPVGIEGRVGDFNAPTVFNSALNFRQFWNGRALTLEDQALGPIENEAELDHDLDSVLAALNDIPEFADAFSAVYADGITVANLSDAIAYYEIINFTGLSTPFLRQFEGDAPALNAKAIRGQQRFIDIGCASCHNGVNLGGNSYQALGIAEPWYGSDRIARAADDGLAERTGREADRHVFKVPTLHHVAATGPWFHDGSVTSLQQAVDRMARYQLGRTLETRDIDDIVAFLRTLGDNADLLGDCTATGTYGVTMNCSMKTRVTDTETVPQRPTLPDAATLARNHEAAYTEALAIVAAAPERIATEMRRVRSGDVAHYDFLQYEHIEMLRHARALSFPPAQVETAQRDALLAQATELQQAAADYELVIGDFLRHHAVASSARANFLDLLKVIGQDADEATRTTLAAIEVDGLAFYAEPTAANRAVFEAATEALQALAADPQRLAELKLQVRLMVEHVVLV